MVNIPDIYDRLATKYKFLLDKMEVMSGKIDGIQGELKELRRIITDTILEVTTK